jgi:hypothetical protein
MPLLLRSRLLLLAFAFTVLLAGCATALPVPPGQPVGALPRWLHVVMQTGQAAPQDAILVVQHDAGDATRWSLMDPLGSPLARQTLTQGRWKNDGFLPPNGSASALFSALVFAWTPEAALPARYPGAPWRVSHDAAGRELRTWGDAAQPRFQVSYEAGSDALTLQYGDTTWRLSALPGAPR